jgi:hypothetical protein
MHDPCLNFLKPVMPPGTGTFAVDLTDHVRLRSHARCQRHPCNREYVLVHICLWQPDSLIDVLSKWKAFTWWRWQYRDKFNHSSQSVHKHNKVQLLGVITSNDCVGQQNRAQCATTLLLGVQIKFCYGTLTFLSRPVGQEHRTAHVNNVRIAIHAHIA